MGEEKTESNRGEESKESTSTEASKWEMVVELVQTAFRGGQLAEEAKCQAVFLIPKG